MTAGSSFRSSARQCLRSMDTSRLNLPCRRRGADASRDCGLVTAQSEIKDYEMTEQGNDESDLNVRGVGDAAHRAREYGAADDCHDQKRGADLCEVPEAVDAKSEDRGKHDGVEKSDEYDGPGGDVASRENYEQKADDGRKCKKSQQPRRRKDLHDGGTGKAAEHEANKVRL